MGLDTTHDCWHGAYSAFSRWRNHLAEAAGYTLVTERTDFFTHEQPNIDWAAIVDSNYAGEWDATPADPLVVLIAHSDCDGVIHPAQAEPLADRLEELLPKLDEAESAGHIARLGMRGTTERFITGLREAVKADEDVDFQ